MPILHFKGKSVIQNHHHTVKFHELNAVPKKGLSAKPSLDDNLIIHGDNLAALKALLPVYAGKVKCVYIDPPYNIGNEGWIYNDNVNSPMIQKWLGKEVARDDLARHEKWCCMMYPRLQLLKELLRKDGIIFVSIDDNEIQHLRVMLDEIFGEENFIDCIVWKKRYGGGAKEKFLISVHEYTLMYAKSKESLSPIMINLSDDSITRYYTQKDENYDRLGPFRTHPLEATKSMEDRPNLVYGIPGPEGKEILPKRQWLWGKDRTTQALKDGVIAFLKDKSGQWSVHTKQYLYDASGEKRMGKAFSIIDDVYTQHGTNEIIDIFGDAQTFPFPKPSKFVRKLIELATSSNEDRESAIIMDSFAGSGTTAHAVLAQNKEDGGSRKFILVELEDYAHKITAERVRRVMKGVPKAKDAALQKGLGGSFSYYELGDPVDIDAMLEGKKLPSYDNLAQYTFFTATGEALEPNQVDQEKYYLGRSSAYEVFMMYKPESERLRGMALNLEFAEAIEKQFPGKAKLVFAPACYLEEFDLRERNIRFAQLPFEIYRLAE